MAESPSSAPQERAYNIFMKFLKHSSSMHFWKQMRMNAARKPIKETPNPTRNPYPQAYDSVNVGSALTTTKRKSNMKKYLFLLIFETLVNNIIISKHIIDSNLYCFHGQ